MSASVAAKIAEKENKVTEIETKPETKPQTPGSFLALPGGKAETKSEPVQAPAKEYPFYAPEPKFPTWQRDMATSESHYYILQKAAGVTDPFSEVKVPTLFFAASVYQEVLYMVKRMAKKTGECGCFLMIRQLQDARPHFLAYDYFIPGQTASSGEVDLDTTDTTKYWNYLRETYPEEFASGLHRKLAHAHSHGTVLGAFYSGTDQTQQNSRGQLGYFDDYRIYVVFGKDGNEIKAGFVQYYPFFHRIEDINVGLYFGDPQYCVRLTRERKQELDAKMDTLVHKKTVTGPRGRVRRRPRSESRAPPASLRAPLR
jgi:hypothetical protein